MTHLVVGDGMNVLREIGIDFSQFLGVDSIAASSRNLDISDSTQFVILLVKVSLECFSRGQELQHGNVACREAPACARLLRERRGAACSQAGSHGYCADGC